MADGPTHRFLGIDPGTNILGFAVIEAKGHQLELLEMGVVHLKHYPSQPLKLKRIFEGIQEIIRKHRPEEMAIESPFYGKNVQSMLKLGRAQGVAIAAAITNGVPITEYSPKSIKQAITGNGNAAKEQVSAMLGHLLHMDLGEHYLDASDALAAAVCHVFQSQSLFGKSRKYNDWSGFIQDHPGRVKGS